MNKAALDCFPPPLKRGSKSTAALALCLTIAGCGYSTNGTAPAETGYQWRSLYRQDVHTIAVPIFGNKDFSRGNEFELSKALVNQIEAHTPYKVVPADRADTILTGEITGIQVNKISDNRFSGVPQEQVMIVSCNFTWKDLRNGKILVDRRQFQEAAPYYPTLGESRATANEETAEKLAMAIVEELQSDW